MKPLKRDFYCQEDVVSLSQQLLGKYLMTHIDGKLTGGMILETEAYKGAEDRACHAYKNKRTKRTEAMFDQGGVAYVYLCYGMHNLFNVVTNQKNIPHAILIRAITPEIGIETMQLRRKTTSPNQLTSGPGKVCQALNIQISHNASLLTESPVWIEDRGITFQNHQIEATPRIGVSYAQEDALLPWRFLLKKEDFG